MMTLLPVAIFVFAASWAATWAMMHWLVRRTILDHPVERSSHKAPVPKGGGVAVIAVLLAGWVWLAANGMAPPETLLVSALAFALAALSWLNDVTDLPAAVRLAVHLLIASVGLLALPDRGHVFQGLLPFPLDEAATVVTWVWFLNLFNFMDGIDGITAIEAGTIGGGLAAIGALSDALPIGQFAMAVVVAAAALGFLPWNWHPSRVFLGDVGSVPLGFVVGWLLLRLAGGGAWVPALLLPLYYLADATITLVRRIAGGERIWRAHRTHFYQRALGADGNHGAVATMILTGNLALVAASVVAIWQPMPALVLGVVVTALLLLLLDRRGRAPGLAREG